MAVIGVLFLDPPKNALITARNYIYDGGTVSRPYDFDNLEEAQNYHLSHANTILFSKEHVADFKKAIKQDPQKYNEMLVRLHFTSDNNCQVFIYDPTANSMDPATLTRLRYEPE